ncbi:hypothetical protein Barb6_00162 [Bacteroidales bacterium Barb6]|nr:hypothetical protein Barb6_00162 [Bacteroidales bacterium Barb6]
MRLTEIKSGISYACLKFDYKTDKGNGGVIYYIRNIQQLRKSIMKLIELGYLSTESELIQEIASTTSDFISFDQNAYNKCVTELNKIRYMLICLRKWSEGYIKESDTETTVCIKLPPIKDLKDLVKKCELVQRSLSQIVPEIGGGEIAFKQLEYGSDLIIIDVSTEQALNFIGEIVNIASVAVSAYIAYKLGIARVNDMEADTEHKKVFTEMTRKLMKLEINKASKELESKYFPEKSDNERIRRIEVAIDSMKELLAMGGEVYPAATVPKEIACKFPDFKSLSPDKNCAALFEKVQGTEESDQAGDANE